MELLSADASDCDQFILRVYESSADLQKIIPVTYILAFIDLCFCSCVSILPQRMSSPSSHGVRTSLASWIAILMNNLVFLMTLTTWTDVASKKLANILYLCELLIICMRIL